MSGRNELQSVESSDIIRRARSGSLVRPCMTWTKVAVAGSPLVSTSTSALSEKLGSPSNSREVSDHQRSCSGRSLLRRAASSDSNRAAAMKRPSSVTPAVVPSQPSAPGASSSAQRSRAALTRAGSATRPLMTCTNMSDLPGRGWLGRCSGTTISCPGDIGVEGARVRYEIVAETYRDLEQASGRLALIERLAELVRQTPDELLPTVCLLCQGQIAPDFAGVELGMAARALAQVLGLTGEQVLAQARETGDLGLAAERLLAEVAGSRPPTLEVETVYAGLHQVAEAQGTGSQARKLAGLVGLLTQATP